MPNTKQIQRVRSVLDTLAEALADEYQCCALQSEADVQAAVVNHLKTQLRQDSDRWIVGANHTLGDYRPDVICYSAPETYQGFRDEHLLGEESLVAAIEIKWAASLKQDLKKLRVLQKKQRGNMLAWMVYGGHFDPTIHRVNAVQDERRASAITKWAETEPLRGSTIIQCGELSAGEETGNYTERLRAMRDHWWINDRVACSRVAVVGAGGPELTEGTLKVLKSLKKRGANEASLSVSKYLLMEKFGCGPHLPGLNEQGLIDWTDERRGETGYRSPWTLWITEDGLRAIDNHVLVTKVNRASKLSPG